MAGGLSTFSSTTTAPAGWTRTAYSTTSVTFRATSWANAIATGASVNFPIIYNFRQANTDTTELLRDIRARFTTSTTGPPFSRVGTDSDSNQGGWTLKSLSFSFQITDTSGVPITSLIAGSSYRVVATVTNRSTATQSSIITSPNPPTQSAPGFSGSAPTLASTAYSPNPLTLAPGASGTITFTYNTSATGYGTVSYTAFVRNNTGSATSTTLTSTTLSIGLFSANIVVSSNCVYNATTMTITMTLTNRYTYDLINIVPTLTPSAPAILSLTSGPTMPSTTVTANGGTLAIQWVYLLSGATPGQTFTFSGSATGAGAGGNPGRTTPTNTSPVATAAGYNITMDDTNASSTNAEITWTLNNQGCSNIASVAVNIPAGWTWSGDSYSLVDTNATTSVETWTVAGANPVTFTAPIVSDQLYLTGDGEFRLTFSSTPSVLGTSTFTLTITHASGVVSTRQTPVTINAYNFNSLNDASGQSWQEQVR